MLAAGLRMKYSPGLAAVISPLLELLLLEPVLLELLLLELLLLEPLLLELLLLPPPTE